LQTKNAHRRLVASLLEGKHLSPADGGPAELQDLVRVLLALAACDRRDAALFRPLVAAAMALLPDIMAAAATAPEPGAEARPGTPCSAQSAVVTV
jgi:streptomycin 6-kinase